MAVPPQQPAPIVVARPPIESKVAASTATATVVGLAGALLNLLVANSALMSGLPDWLQFLIIMIGPGLATFLAGYSARHTPR